MKKVFRQPLKDDGGKKRLEIIYEVAYDRVFECFCWHKIGERLVFDAAGQKN